MTRNKTTTIITYDYFWENFRFWSLKWQSLNLFGLFILFSYFFDSVLLQVTLVQTLLFLTVIELIGRNPLTKSFNTEKLYFVNTDTHLYDFINFTLKSFFIIGIKYLKQDHRDTILKEKNRNVVHICFPL